MNKRKRENSIDRMQTKIRRLEKELNRRRSRHLSSSSSHPSVEEDRSVASDLEILSYHSDSDYEVAASAKSPQSPSQPCTPPRPASPPTSPLPVPEPIDPIVDTAADSIPAVVIIAPDILEVLGEAKTKEVPLGQKIPEEVSKRWGRILTDGLSRTHKQDLINKILIPENFPLLKAPLLNQEISAVLTDSSRNRDKRLEKAQNQLGIGLAGITTLMSNLIEGKEIEKVEMVKRLSEIGQILLDLHYENSINRMKLITPVLDKKFLTMINNVKRDAYLFGNDLGGTIKATKTAERSGLQIKKPTYVASSSKNFTSSTGSWKGPPRQQGQRGARQSNRSRGGGSAAQAPKRSSQAPAAERSSARSTRTTRK